MTRPLRKLTAILLALGAILATPSIGAARVSCPSDCFKKCYALYPDDGSALADCYEACLNNECGIWP